MQVDPDDLLCIIAVIAGSAWEQFLNKLGQLADLHVASKHEDHGSLKRYVWEHHTPSPWSAASRL